MFIDGKTHVLVCNLNPTHLVLIIATGITVRILRLGHLIFKAYHICTSIEIDFALLFYSQIKT